MPPKEAPNGPSPKDVGSPNQTLYVKNLNDKIHKTELKRALYMLFSTYGSVLDIITQRVGARKQSMRGQAHVVFRDVHTATQAMRSLQAFELFSKKMVIVYGRGTSNIIPKLRGTFEAPVATPPVSEQTALQQSIFNAPPGTVPPKPVGNGVSTADEKVTIGQSDASMEEDEDDAAMEEDSD
ncbi:hypothetical protein DV737_g1881, partial [Chaetothyriales sp. CBS 132003]